MGNFLKLNEVSLEDRSIISGIFSGGQDKCNFILKRSNGLCWTLILRIQDGQYFEYRSFPITDKNENEYPSKTMTWLFNNADIVEESVKIRQNSIKKVGAISIFDKIEVEIDNQYLHEDGSYVQGKIISSSDRCYFQLMLVSEFEPWTLFINPTRYPVGEVLCNFFPEFKKEDYFNRKIIDWLGQNMKRLVKASRGEIQ